MRSLPPRAASLRAFFAPTGIAVVGASRDPAKLSRGVLRNLLGPEGGFPGPIYPVNPRAESILGLTCYPDIASVPDPVDLAILVIPAGSVASAVEACGRRGIRAVVVISSGFREVGAAGAARETALLEIAERHGLRIMGPNGIGVIDTHLPLNTTFVKGMPPQGKIAFVSQSGAVCASIIDWSIGKGIGFSTLLSLGNKVDVDESDVIWRLATDDRTKVIALYLEDVKRGTPLVDALANAAESKSVIALKAGRTIAGKTATASHTGALAGEHAAFRAACRRSGVIEVETISALFNGAVALADQPPLAGRQIALVTNAGGPAALAADALESAGLSLARTSPDTAKILRSFLHPDAQVDGPIDLLGGADEGVFRRTVAAALADPEVDGVLAILVPQVLMQIEGVARAIGEAASDQCQPRKPVLACLMGGASMHKAFDATRAATIPSFAFPEEAVAAFGVLMERAEALARLARRDAAPTVDETARSVVHALLAKARITGQKALDAADCRPILEAYGIQTPRDCLANSPEEAAEYGRRLGFPVALKLASPDLLHKSDAGAVLLGIEDADAASEGFRQIMTRVQNSLPKARVRGVQVQSMIEGGQETILGVKRDPTFGPIVMFGLGGIYVEALGDVSFRLAPLSLTDAWEMIMEVRSAKILAGLRGKPGADRAALADAMVRISQLAIDHPAILELDINPMLVLSSGSGASALDARIVLDPRVGRSNEA